MEENVTLLAAFGAGLLSFISPCVLPLIPGYLSYISGLSLDEMRGVPVAAGGTAVVQLGPSRASHPTPNAPDRSRETLPERASSWPCAVASPIALV